MTVINPDDVERLEKTGDLKPLKSNIIYLRTHFITKVLTDKDDISILEAKAKNMGAINVHIVSSPHKVFNAMFQTEKQAMEFGKTL
jgi:hypothetical protein